MIQYPRDQPEQVGKAPRFGLIEVASLQKQLLAEPQTGSLASS